MSMAGPTGRERVMKQTMKALLVACGALASANLLGRVKQRPVGKTENDRNDECLNRSRFGAERRICPNHCEWIVRRTERETSVPRGQHGADDGKLSHRRRRFPVDARTDGKPGLTWSPQEFRTLLSGRNAGQSQRGEQCHRQNSDSSRTHTLVFPFPQLARVGLKKTLNLS